MGSKRPRAILSYGDRTLQVTALVFSIQGKVTSDLLWIVKVSRDLLGVQEHLCDGEGCAGFFSGMARSLGKRRWVAVFALLL